MNLEGKVALVSGGLGDIGRAIAVALTERGAKVALCDIREPSDAEREALINPAIRTNIVDVRNAVAVERWVTEVADVWGTPDLIIPNAAVVTLTDILSIDPDAWERELAVNLSGAFYLAQAAAKRLVSEGKAGRIVFVGSWAAQVSHPHVPAYSVAKAGLRMLGKTMALSLAPYGILVNEVAPGYVDAGLSAEVFRQEPERRTRAEQVVPVGTLITPEEVAQAVAYLCDPSNRQMTGSVLLLDGGLSLRGGGGDA